jgi:major membrane immunogen (membrane-anchored lipoprotein)
VRGELYNILVTGDAAGKLVVCEFDFDIKHGRFESLEKTFVKEKAHEKAIVKLERYSNTDLVVSASNDQSFIFWNT